MDDQIIRSPTGLTKAAIGLDRVFIRSIPGIFNAVALVLAFSAMVAVEVGKYQYMYGFVNSDSGFHQFNTIASSLTFWIFTLMASLKRDITRMGLSYFN